MYLIFEHFLEYLILFSDDSVDEESKISNSKSSASGCYLAFAWFFYQFQPGVAYKMLLINKTCTLVTHFISNPSATVNVFQRKKNHK